MPLSPLQKRIGALCARVVETDDVIEFQRVTSELKAALREQVDHVRTMVSDAKRFSSALHPEPLQDKTREEKTRTLHPESPQEKTRHKAENVTLVVISRKESGSPLKQLPNSSEKRPTGT